MGGSRVVAWTGLFSVGLALVAGGGCRGGESGGGGASSAGTGGGGGATGPCSIAHQGTSGVAIQGTLLTSTAVMAGEVLIDASGKIACAASSCASAPGYADATVVACPDAVVSPGLINAHDHTDFATAGPIDHGTTRWEHRNGWRKGTDGEQKLAEPGFSDDPTINATGELRFVLGGATSIVGSGGTKGLLRNLAAYPDESLLEAGAVGPTAFFDTFPLGDQDGTEITSGCAYPNPRSASSAFGSGAAYVPHVAEGINLAAENEFTCVAGSLGLLTDKTAIIHGVGMNAHDVQAMAAAHAKLIWSPRTNVSLYGNTAPVTEFKALGVTIALGTDWLASGSMNMLRELQCADFMNKTYFGTAFTDQELWLMATKNAAIAAGFDAQIGDLAPGLLGDVAVFTGATKDYRAVIDAGVEDVRLVLRGGKVLYGDKAIVEALDPTCHDFDACGVAKQVCIDAPGVALGSIEASANGIYPLFFCKGTTPTNEPSCVPYRGEYPSGPKAGDADGDGVPDANDVCPMTFDPVRPMDGAAQADVDGDGQGDACDASPAG
ncbi:MAG TPA: amidohydrolase family protein [Minicystis sp.]|nr:amidohydrolase family protein [Minicystis sp.]